MANQLLILDINGILVCKLGLDSIVDGDILQLKSYKVLIRPHIKQFLEWCFDKYDVAIYTSTTKPNATKIMEEILGRDFETKFCFTLYRDYTIADPDDKTGYNTVKLLSKIFDDPKYNKDKLYGVHNTIIVDDDFNKVRLNNINNVLVVESFDGKNDKDSINILQDMIDKRFNELQQK